MSDVWTTNSHRYQVDLVNKGNLDAFCRYLNNLEYEAFVYAAHTYLYSFLSQFPLRFATCIAYLTLTQVNNCLFDSLIIPASAGT